MGLLFGKKKKEGGTIIRKTNAGSTPKSKRHSNTSEVTEKSERVTIIDGPTTKASSTGPNSLPSNGASNTGNTGDTIAEVKSPSSPSIHAPNEKPLHVTTSTSVPSTPVIRKITETNSTINFGEGSKRKSQEGEPIGDTVHVAVSVSGTNHYVAPTPTSIPIIGGEDVKFTQKPLSELSTLERVVNLYGLSLSLFTITRALLTAQEWDDPLLIQLMSAASSDLDRELCVLKNMDRLKDWSHPLHYRKTGSVLGAGRVLASNYRYYLESMDKLKQTGGKGFVYSDQRQLKECLKELLRSYVNFISCCELVVPSDFNGEINELARTMRDVVDTASGKMNYVFDDVARICTTCSVRLARLSLWKSIQATSMTWIRQVSDTCFTVTKASKVLYHIGLRLYEHQDDQAAYQNLTALTKGVVMHIKKLQGMIQQEPADSKPNNYVFTAEIVAEHLATYDQGMKEVTASLNSFIKSNSEDKTIIDATNTILQQVEAIKATVQSPDTAAVIFAVANISESVEKFCGSIYYALHQVGEDNEVIKEQMMETMQHAIHCIIQLQVVACAKGLSFPVVNTEFTLLNCLRSLLLAASVVIEGVHHLKRQNLVVYDATEEALLTNDDINEAIVYILHYGRPLFRGDEGDQNSAEEVSEKPDEIEDLDFGLETPSRYAEKSSIETLSKTSSKISAAEKISIENPSKTSSKMPSETPKAAEKIIETPSKPAEKHMNATPTNNQTDDEEHLLSLNPDSFNENNLPPGFEPPPPKPVFSPGSSEEAYKSYMVAKYEYETWENKLILHKMKLKKQIEEIKARRK